MNSQYKDDYLQLISQEFDSEESMNENIINTASLRSPRIIIFGEPRGLAESLSEKLSKFFEVPIFDCSNLLNIKNIKQNKIPISCEIKLKLALISEVHEGFIINNVPLKVEDLKCIHNIDLGIFISPDEEKTIAFNINRRWCPTCFRTYHLEVNQPLHDGRCNRCDSILEKLPEDDPKVISDKFFQWKQIIHPLIEKFREERKLLKANSTDINEISKVVFRILKGDRKEKENKDKFEPSFTV